jgi:NAD(P)-dependent dehydrogenase (short-subunit alcohol dehydrogenase family)
MEQKFMNIPTPDRLLDLTNKVALITGASSGLGAGIARRFAQAGANIVICDLKAGDDIRQEIQDMGRECFTTITDVTDPEQIDELFDEVEQRLSLVDILINNAGIYPNATFLEMTPKEWDIMMTVNLKSVFLTMQTAAKRMIRAGKGGAIVNISSIESMIPAYGHAHYAASKAGVVMLGKSAALEFGSHDIRVNSVSPSLINRPNLAQEWPEGVDRFLNRVPLRRIGEVEDIADACLFLASDAARWITGMNLVVDGGVLVCQAF